MWPLEATCARPGHLITNCGLNVLTGATAATCLVSTMTKVTATVGCGVSVRDLRAESAIAACKLLSVCCLCAFAGRLRYVL